VLRLHEIWNPSFEGFFFSCLQVKPNQRSGKKRNLDANAVQRSCILDTYKLLLAKKRPGGYKNEEKKEEITTRQSPHPKGKNTGLYRRHQGGR